MNQKHIIRVFDLKHPYTIYYIVAANQRPKEFATWDHAQRYLQQTSNNVNLLPDKAYEIVKIYVDEKSNP